jgi:hypothetical protein
MTDHPLGLGMTGFLISGWLRECARMVKKLKPPVSKEIT